MILAAVVIAGPIIYWVRRRWVLGQGRDDAGLSMGGIERMRRSGMISDEEFSRLRRSALNLDSGETIKEDSKVDGESVDDDERETEQGIGESPCE